MGIQKKVNYKLLPLGLFICIFYAKSFTQNVGIGTTSPQGTLQINHSGNLEPGLILLDSVFMGAQQFRNLTYSDRMFGFKGYVFGNGAENMYLDFHTDSLTIATFRGNGSMGLGSLNPVSKLEIATNSDFTANKHQLLLEEQDNDFARMSFKNSNGLGFHIAGYKGLATNGNQDRLNFYSPAIAQDALSLSGDGDVSFHRALKPAGQAGLAGQVLTSNGTEAAPTWENNNPCMQNMVKFGPLFQQWFYIIYMGQFLQV